LIHRAVIPPKVIVEEHMWFCRGAAAALSLALVLGAVSAQAQQSFDGRWSVEVVTERGDCDRAYRYLVAVENGRVRYAGETGGFSISGRVAPNGTVQGSITSSQGRADVRGRLAGSSGSGNWTISGSRSCAGRWNADKRG
jgi:hypothetical protein